MAVPIDRRHRASGTRGRARTGGVAITLTILVAGILIAAPAWYFAQANLGEDSMLPLIGYGIGVVLLVLMGVLYLATRAQPPERHA